jgi:SAM-dependent methyltransferase
MPSGTYRWLAKYYDLLFEHEGGFDNAREHVLGKILPRIESACDLCCGTGRTAIRLASRGIKTSGIDLSPEMCRRAREKARKAGLKVKVARGDMRGFRLPEPVDLVTCECDAINHIPQKKDLKRVANSVARALKPGGYFAFDVNNRRAFERLWSTAWFLEKDPVAMIMHGQHEPGTDKARTDVEWFVREGKSWKRYHEHVEEVCWSGEEIRSVLTGAGFDRIRSWDAAPFFNDAVTLPGNRTFWLARKRS